MSHRQVLQPCMKNFSYSSAEHSLYHKPEWQIRKILQVQNNEKKWYEGKKSTILLDGCAQGGDHFELQLDFEILSSTDRVCACEE